MPERFSGDNQLNQELERQSGVSRFVGLDAETEKQASDFMYEKFENQSGKRINRLGENVEDLEREKTEEEKEAIRKVLDYMNEFIKKYGGNPLPIREDHIHILDKNKLGDLAKEKVQNMNQSGEYIISQQLLYIFDSGNILRNVLNIVHELLHFQSFQSLQKTMEDQKDGNTELAQRRIGVLVENVKNDRSYLNGLNEAITVELSMRFDRDYLQKIENLKKEITARNAFYEEIIKKSGADRGIEEFTSASVIGQDGGSKTYLFSEISEEYLRLRKILMNKVRNIFEKSRGEFKSEDEVFDIFVRAVMEGNLFPVARLLGKIPGEGTLRDIDEEFKIIKV